jgi:predicted dehydrogenase
MPVLSAFDDVRVDWLCDLDVGRARELANRFGVRNALARFEDAPEVDVVLVATPVGSRRAMMTTIAGRRWHAFCEKPFAARVEDHEWMLDLMAKSNRRVGVGLVRRHYVSTRKAEEVLAAGLLGGVEAILAGEGIRARKFGRGGDWYQSSAEASGGVFFETGSHLVDQVLTIVDAQRFEIRQCRQERVAGLEMETRLSASLTLADGATVPLTLAVSRLNDVYNGIVVRCRNGEMRVALDPEGAVSLCDRKGATIGVLPGGAKPAIYGALRAEWREFLDVCRRPGGPPADTGLLTTRFIAQAYARGSVPSPRTMQEHVS